MSKTEPPKIPHGIDEIRKLFLMFEDDPGVFEVWLNELEDGKEYELLSMDIHFNWIYYPKTLSSSTRGLYTNRKKWRERDEKRGKKPDDNKIKEMKQIKRMVLGIKDRMIYIRFYKGEEVWKEYFFSMYKIGTVGDKLEFSITNVKGRREIRLGVEIGWRKKRIYSVTFVVLNRHDKYIVFDNSWIEINKNVFNFLKRIRAIKRELKERFEREKEKWLMEQKMKVIEIQEEPVNEFEEDSDLEISLLSTSSEKEISISEFSSSESKEEMSIDTGSETD